MRQNSSGQEKYGGFLIDLIEELSEAANVSRTLSFLAPSGAQEMLFCPSIHTFSEPS